MAARKSPAQPAAPAGGLVRLRPRLLVGMAVLLAAGYLGYLAWQTHVPAVRQHANYRITADRIQLSAPPPWIRMDIRRDVLRDFDPLPELSLLDGEASLARLKEAFEFHPWVENVERISKQLPAGILIELAYRKPAAAIEVVGEYGTELLVADTTVIRLPEGDLSEVERRYLPRITGVTEIPPIGQRWTDPRIVSGIRLAMELGDTWQSLRLVEIVPRPGGGLSAESPVTSFHIYSSGGTRIVWGAAPGEESPPESPFAVKLERLQSYANEFGNLDTIRGPEEIDVRSELNVQRRAERRNEEEKLADDETPQPIAERTDSETPDKAQKEVATRSDDEDLAR